MNGPQFFQTQMGHKYYQSDLPRQIKAMNRLAEAIEKQNELADGNRPKSNKPRVTSDDGISDH